MLTFQARTGEDQDNQDQKKHVPSCHCRPTNEKRKTRQTQLVQYKKMLMNMYFCQVKKSAVMNKEW